MHSDGDTEKGEIWYSSVLYPPTCSRNLAHTMYTGKTETFMAAVWYYLFTRIFHICPSRNQKTTRSQFGLKCSQTKLLIMWQVGTGNLVVLVKTFSLTISGTNTKIKKLHTVHVLGDFNFRDIDWPDRLNKSGSALSQSEGQMLIDIINDHGLEKLVHFPTREKITLDLLLNSLPGQFRDIHSPDKLSDHDVVTGTLKVVIPPIKKPRRKVYLYKKGDYESIRKDAFEFAKEKYFNGYPDTRSLQENFNLITSFYSRFGG